MIYFIISNNQDNLRTIGARYEDKTHLATTPSGVYCQFSERFRRCGIQAYTVLICKYVLWPFQFLLSPRLKAWLRIDWQGR